MNQTPLPVSSSSSSHHDDNDGSFSGDLENQQQQQIFIMSSVVDGQSFNFHLLQQLFAVIGVVATVISVIAVLYYYYLHYFKISSTSTTSTDENTKPVQEKVLESPSTLNNNNSTNNTKSTTAPSSLPSSFHIRSFETLFATQQQSVQYFFDNVNMKQFERVNRILLECSNNNHLVHFCGVGKSGVVAQKLAVTLTSTGTRSLYLNPTDALHGDLGMVQEGDVVILISKSGESDELVKLMPFLNNRLSTSSCIAMVSNKHSRLAKLCGESNILEMPMLQELCPFNMVPTTSVALQMIMGDVLAVSLMEHKQVHLDQFAKNHPAGRIGKRLCLKVRDVMMVVVGQQQESNMKNVDFVVDVDMLAYDAMKMMKEKSVASLPVVDSRREENENVVGLLRLQDLVQAGL